MFTPDQVAALGDDAALIAPRQAAYDRAAAAGLPSFEEEVWRYTPIDDLVPSSYTVAAPGGELAPGGLVEDVLASAAAVVSIVNGQVVDVDVRNNNVEVLHGAGAADAVASVMTEAVDVFADLNTALTSSPVLVRIPRGKVVEAPIVIRHHTAAADLAWFPRLIVEAGENSEATIVEHHTSASVRALVCPVTEVGAGQAARIRLLTVQELGPEVWQLATQRSVIGRDAHVAASQVALGGGYARARVDTVMAGNGASGDISAVYFGRDDAQLDFRTFQQHVAPHTTSNLLFKGAVDDQSRAIYTGMIRIEPDAHHVAAYQTNRNLKLSEDAWAESVPNLEIENNDVTCSHASAVGPVDEDQRFYLESRGVPTDLAESLVVRGFFSEVLEALPLAPIAAATGDRIAALLALDLEVTA